MEKTYAGNNYNNYSNYSKPAFGAIKSIRCEGLYKKYPNMCQELVEALQKNQTAMDFFKKYDVNIVFDAFKHGIAAVDSSINIIYDNIAKSKFRKFFDSLNGSKDTIRLEGFGQTPELLKSIKASTDALKKTILPEPEGNGVLGSHIEIAEKNIQNILNRKAEKYNTKQAKLNAKESAEQKQVFEKKLLDDSIQNLIDNTSNK